MSFANLMLYGAVLPSYSPKNDKDSKGKGGGKKVLRADDPEDQEEIMRTFNTSV